MEYFYEGSAEAEITPARAGELLDTMLEQLGPLKRVLLIPPDFTRHHSWAGELTVQLWKRLEGRAHVEILPALGTHVAMTAEELSEMFPGVPHELFRVHDWREGLVKLGEVPGSFISEISGGRLDYSIPCEVDRLLVEGNWDRIISIGQLVPHEVIGIANHNKNIYVGTGGQATINRTHFLGAACNMERIMGRAETPVRAVFDYMDREFCGDLPISYVLSVRSPSPGGKLITRGLYAGNDKACFQRGAALCRQVNLELIDEPLKKVIVRLDSRAYKSTWLGNKAIYRTRMAMADGGELIVLAPGVRHFGEDEEIDRLIRRYGYRGTDHTLEMVRQHPELANNLSAAAHLIHGSSEGRFKITYCAGALTRHEVESVGFTWGNLDEMVEHYRPESLIDGWNRLPGGEEVFYISNPSYGLWGLKSQFPETEPITSCAKG